MEKLKILLATVEGVLSAELGKISGELPGMLPELDEYGIKIDGKLTVSDIEGFAKLILVKRYHLPQLLLNPAIALLDPFLKKLGAHFGIK